MKYFSLVCLSFGLLLLLISEGCAVFSTPQERSGINPKPFNSQSYWEVQTDGGRIFN